MAGIGRWMKMIFGKKSEKLKSLLKGIWAFCSFVV